MFIFKDDFGRDTTKCPDCGSMNKTLIYSTTTLMYVPQVYDDEGYPIESRASNKILQHFVCNKCGRNFTNDEE